MKVIYEHWRGSKTLTVKQAVEHKLIPDSYSYNGKLEQMQEILKLQSEMIAELIERLADKNLISKLSLEAVLGYGFIVEDGDD